MWQSTPGAARAGENRKMLSPWNSWPQPTLQVNYCPKGYHPLFKGKIAKFVGRNATDQRDPGAGWQRGERGIRHQIPISSSEKQRDQTHHPALIDWQCLMMFWDLLAESFSDYSWEIFIFSQLCFGSSLIGTSEDNVVLLDGGFQWNLTQVQDH